MLTGLLGVLFFLFPSLAPYFRVAHIHLGVLGFFLSMVMGVAYWMMLRPGGLRQEGLEATTFHLLSSGLFLRALAEPWWRYTGAGLPRGLSALMSGPCSSPPFSASCAPCRCGSRPRRWFCTCEGRARPIKVHNP